MAYKPRPLTHKYRLGDQAPILFPGGEQRIVSREGVPHPDHPYGGADGPENPVLCVNSTGIRTRTSGNTSCTGARGSAFSARTDGYGRRSSVPATWPLSRRGTGHYVEQVGNEDTRILILFNSPVYQEISLSAWLGGNPSSLLEDNFSLPRSVVEQMPKKSRGIVKG